MIVRRLRTTGDMLKHNLQNLRELGHARPKAQDLSRRTCNRRGLATLELVLALPILLC